jgi:hypothetical protein
MSESCRRARPGAATVLIIGTRGVAGYAGYSRQSLAIYRKTGYRRGEGAALARLGYAYQQLRQPDRATACWQEAAAALRDAGDHDLATGVEQLVANTRPRHRWLVLRRRSPS